MSAHTLYNHGFWSKDYCESQPLLTTYVLLTSVDRKEQVDVAMLDFSKALDTVPHLHLLRKLELPGIHGEILSWIRSFLTARTQGWWSRAVTPKHMPWPPGFHRGPYLGPYFSCVLLMKYSTSVHRWLFVILINQVHVRQSPAPTGPKFLEQMGECWDNTLMWTSAT